MARLLLVDDDRDVLKILRTAFLARGHEAIAFSDPAEARLWLRSRAPDGVLLDVRMPVVSGWDLLGEIRSDPRTARLPVVMLSANGDVDERVRGLRLGADDFCVKPLHIEEIVARIERLLERRDVDRGGLRGDLGAFPLADVLQSVEQQKLSGALEIDVDGRRGRARFRNGRAVEAAYGGLTGTEALLELLALDSGGFRFAEEAGALAQPLDSPLLSRAAELLLERAWLDDELASRRARLPEPDALIVRGTATLSEIKLETLPSLPIATLAAVLEPGPLCRRDAEDRLHVATTRAALALAVLLESGVAVTAPPVRREVEKDDPLAALATAVPGFEVAVLLEASTGAALAVIGGHEAFDPAALARSEGAAIIPMPPFASASKLEELAVVYDDRLHLLRAIGEGRWLFLAALRRDDRDEAQLRRALQRHFPAAGQQPANRA